MDKNKNEKIIVPLKFEPLSDNRPTTSFAIKRSTAMIVFALLICAAIAVFLFVARAVYIETTPTNARIEVAGFMHLKLADRYLLLGGEHKLSLSAPGYYPLQKNLLVTGEQDQHYTFELQRLPGHLRVSTAPVNGAEIFIDDVSMGKTPALLHNIKPGERHIHIAAERYFPFDKKLLIEGLDKEQSLKVKLVPAWADVKLATQPGGADIFVDDKRLGKTPLTAEILQGKHRIRLKLAGYKPWQDEIKVTANVALDLTDIKLELADAVVFLASIPARANATLDGEYKGLTPLELALKPAKKSSISLFKEGYKPASREITVNSGDKQRLTVRLAPELVKVDFNITPADARLTVDGVTRGAARQTLALPATTHRIEISKPGYISYKAKISPHAGIPQQVNVKLKTERQAKLEKIKPVYTNSAGQTLKLFYPTPFTMGASRREPGRRANETIRKIILRRPFYLGTHEVSNAEYRKFARDHVSGTVQGHTLNGGNQPVVALSWEQAARYCNWLSRAESLPLFYREKDSHIVGVNPAAFGYRLPTEAEWAWAARYRGRNALLKFPWGEKMPPKGKVGNFADSSAAGFLGRVIGTYNDGYMVSAPVGQFPANNKGLFDMGGNVAEWTHDFYDIQLSVTNQAEIDPLGPDTGKFHVIRGSSWAHGTVTELRLSYRDYDAKARDDVGFRIARYLE